MSMRLLVVTQYFWPEGFRINELVQSLVARGVAVDVLTGKPNYPEGRVFPGYRARGTQREDWEGARVFRVPLVPRGLRSGVRLLLNYLSFIVTATVMGSWMLRGTRPDAILVYATSPLLQALPALFIGRLKAVPVTIYVQDLWPESLEATGNVRNRLVLGLVDQVVRFIYHRADLILVSSLPFKESIARYAPSAPVVYYPNSVDASFGNPDSGLKPAIAALDDGFCVVFAGNVGAAQAVHVIVEAAALLRGHKDIRLVVLGSGSEVGWMQMQITQLGLDNLYLAGRFPVQAMPYLLSRASALLVTLTDRRIFAATVPNKIQAYMAVGRPIIAAMNGEGARIVEQAAAGVAVKAEDGRALADAILALHAMPQEQRKRLGANGRQYYQNHYDHEQLVSDLIERLGETVKEHK